MNIRIETIPHDRQRYNTVGDWTYDRDTDELVILVSQMGCKQYEQAIAVHELIEAILCLHDGVSQEDVDNFDLVFDKASLDMEPGDHSSAPYTRQHCVATGIERLLIAAFDLKWQSYDQNVEKLSQNYRLKKKVQ